MPSLSVQIYGGVNFADEPAGLLRRSHSLERGTWFHRSGITGRPIGIEAADGRNFDLLRENLITRKGSTSNVDLTTTLDGTTTTVDASSLENQKVLNVASTTGFEVGRQIIIDSGGLGGGEETGVIASIQSGVSLTLVDNMTFRHESPDPVAQYLFLGGDRVVLGPVEYLLPETGSYVRYIVSQDTIYTDQSGTWKQFNDSTSALYTHSDKAVTFASTTLLDGGVFFGINGSNKIQRHMGGADLEPEMDNGNAYTDAGGTGQTINGTWGNNYSNVGKIDGRLAFNDGSSTVQVTDTNQPWDLAGGTNFPALGAVKTLIAHVPQFGDSLTAILYIGHGTGWDFTDDFVDANTIEGAPPAMKDSMVINIRNWIVYLSADGGLWGLNGNRVIDLGRRYRALDGSSGPLDNINLGNTLTVGHAAYNDDKQQANFWISTAGSGDPDTTLVLDFQQGEPILDEQLVSYEQHVRCLHFIGQDYVGAGMTQDGFLGARSTGTIWLLENGASDYAATAIDTQWFSPMMDGGAPINTKNVLTWFGRALRSGNWAPQIDFFLDRDTVSSKSIQFNQGAGASVYGTAVYGTSTYSSDGLVKYANDIDLLCEVFQIKISHKTAGENFTITNFDQQYSILAEER